MKEKITQQIDRVLDLLNTLDPTTEAYLTALHAVRELNWLLMDNGGHNIIEPLAMAEPKVEIKPQTAEEAVTENIEEQVSSEPKPVAEPAKPAVVEEAPCSEETAPLSKETVRDILSEAARDGIQIQPIISQFVPEGKPKKLSEVKPADYAALIKAVNDAK